MRLLRLLSKLVGISQKGGEGSRIKSFEGRSNSIYQPDLNHAVQCGESLN